MLRPLGTKLRTISTIASLAAALHAPAFALDDADPETALPAICTDRPTKSNFACTVEQGHLQYEADLINGTLTRSDGVTKDTWLVPNPTIKYGISAALDLELNVAPVVIAHVVAESRTIAGIGDTYLRVKYRFIGNNDSVLSIASIPYVKLPTARSGIGDGKVEEGIIVPVNYKLTDAITLTMVPEVDRLEDVARGGQHLNLVNAFNVAYSLDKATVIYLEIWGDWNYDPGEDFRQYSADIAVTYGLTNLLQIDVGVNAGLNRATPALQGYLGLSQKF